MCASVLVFDAAFILLVNPVESKESLLNSSARSYIKLK